MSGSFIVQNTRLFPKFKGAQAYALTGIAARCDWVVLTDGRGADFSAVLQGNLDRQPRTVFLSLRSPFRGVAYFYKNVLPRISTPFVLITGSEDVTCPRQTDKRSRAFSDDERRMMDDILSDERLLHWFMENRDQVLEKTSSLPVGYVFEKGQSALIAPPEDIRSLAERPHQVFCAHRVRPGEQWEIRRHVTNLCQQHFSEFCTLATGELAPDEFENAVKNHAFVICAQGGGIDPSPKAWLSILNGAIPIMKSGPLDDAYSQLPVAFVEEWTAECCTPQKLDQWQEELGHYHSRPKLRSQTLHRLSLDYWWGKIEAKLV